MKKINVLITDDMQILRTGLKAILEKNDTLKDRTQLAVFAVKNRLD